MSLEQDLERMKMVMERIRAANLKIKGKSADFSDGLLSIWVTSCPAKAWKPTPKRSRPLQDWPVPKKVKNVRSFLGFALCLILLKLRFHSSV